MATAWNRHLERRPLLGFFAIVFGITWGLGAIALLARDWVDAHLGPITASHPAFIIAVYAPSLTAICLTAALEGRPGLTALLGRLAPWRVRWHWSALLLIGLPLSALVASRLIGGAAGHSAAPLNLPALLAAALPAMVLDPGPLGEELGWRGFALPRMLERQPPLAASLVLGGIWGLWHLPGFLQPGIIQSTLPVPVFLLGILAMSVLSTWLFVNSGGSVVPSILLHWIGNSFRLLGIPFEVGAGVAAAWAVAIVGTGQFWKRAGPRQGTLPPAP
jgi:CAAX protease family protein